MEFCQLSLEQSLDHLYKYLKANPSVISCSVSTSLGRRLGSPSNNLLQLTGSVDLQPGSALIICNSKTQLEYESELDYVQDCLHRQLRLEVSIHHLSSTVHELRALIISLIPETSPLTYRWHQQIQKYYYLFIDAQASLQPLSGQVCRPSQYAASGQWVA